MRLGVQISRWKSLHYCRVWTGRLLVSHWQLHTWVYISQICVVDTNSFCVTSLIKQTEKPEPKQTKCMLTMTFFARMTSSPLWWGCRVTVRLLGYGEAAGLRWGCRVRYRYLVFSTSYYLAWSITSVSVWTHHLIVRFLSVFELGLECDELTLMTGVRHDRYLNPVITVARSAPWPISGKKVAQNSLIFNFFVFGVFCKKRCRVLKMLTETFHLAPERRQPCSVSHYDFDADEMIKW